MTLIAGWPPRLLPDAEAYSRETSRTFTRRRPAAFRTSGGVVSPCLLRHEDGRARRRVCSLSSPGTTVSKPPRSGSDRDAAARLPSRAATHVRTASPPNDAAHSHRRSDRARQRVRNTVDVLPVFQRRVRNDAREVPTKRREDAENDVDGLHDGMVALSRAGAAGTILPG